MAAGLFRIVLADDAERDLEDIWRYIASRDGVDRAAAVLNALEAACQALERFPERGNVPKELYDIGLSDYRETHFKPYRIIYRVARKDVIVYCIADGRRDMRSFLLHRLMR